MINLDFEGAKVVIFDRLTLVSNYHQGGEKMITIQHNTNRKSDGKPLQAMGMRASFLKYLEDAVKTVATEGLSPLAALRPLGTIYAWAGAKVTIHVARVHGDVYRISWSRPAGRGGIATGTKTVERVATIRCATNPLEFLTNIVEHPEGLDIEPVG
jgi:hypothetical protein